MPEPFTFSKLTLALIGLVKGLVIYVWYNQTKKVDKVEGKLDSFIEDTYNKEATREQIELKLQPLRSDLKHLTTAVEENTVAQKESNREQKKMTEMLIKLSKE